MQSIIKTVYFFFLMLSVAYLFLLLFVGSPVSVTQYLHEILHVLIVASGLYSIYTATFNKYIEKTQKSKRWLIITFVLVLIHIPLHLFAVEYASGHYEFQWAHLLFVPYLVENLYLLLIVGFMGVFLFGIPYWYINFKNEGKVWLRKTAISVLIVFLVAAAYPTYIHFKTKQGYLSYQQEPNSIYELLSHPKLRGKYVYVDFWHSGCSPCLQEMSGFEKFVDSLSPKERKKFVFLYVGVDRSQPGEAMQQKHWVRKFGIKRYHYFLPKEKFPEWWPQMTASPDAYPAFPYHILVDKQGHIKVKDAPSLGDDLRQIINKL